MTTRCLLLTAVSLLSLCLVRVLEDDVQEHDDQMDDEPQAQQQVRRAAPRELL